MSHKSKKLNAYNEHYKTPMRKIIVSILTNVIQQCKVLIMRNCEMGWSKWELYLLNFL